MSDIPQVLSSKNGACGAKERPRCRRSIIESSLRPHIKDGKWTGWAVEPDPAGGERRVHLSGGIRTQMRLMMAEGFFERALAG